jgi:hypothetical protein
VGRAIEGPVETFDQGCLGMTAVRVLVEVADLGEAGAVLLDLEDPSEVVP